LRKKKSLRKKGAKCDFIYRGGASRKGKKKGESLSHSVKEKEPLSKKDKVIIFLRPKGRGRGKTIFFS